MTLYKDDDKLKEFEEFEFFNIGYTDYISLGNTNSCESLMIGPLSDIKETEDGVSFKTVHANYRILN